MASAALRNARDWGDRDVARLRASPFFQTIRDRPEFQSVLAEMQNDVDIQRSLIENDQRLSQLLSQTL